MFVHVLLNNKTKFLYIERITMLSAINEYKFLRKIHTQNASGGVIPINLYWSYWGFCLMQANFISQLYWLFFGESDEMCKIDIIIWPV